METIKNVICGRCGSIWPEAEIREFKGVRYWVCENCPGHRNIRPVRRGQYVQSPSWTAEDGKEKVRWVVWDPDSGEVIKIGEGEDQFPDVPVYQEPKRHGYVGQGT